MASSPATHGPSRTRKGASTRTRILDTAARLFAERGYHTTTLRDVADAVPISKTGIYHHFASKDALLVGLFEGLIDPVIERAASRRASASQPAEERLRELIADLVELMAHNPTPLQIMLDQFAQLPDETQRALIDRRLRLRSEVQAVLETGMAERDFNITGELPLVPAAILGMCWTYLQTADGGPSPAAAAHTFCELLLPGLRR